MALTEAMDSEKKDKKEKFLTKVIIRRLPPSMDQETFLNQISPVPSYDYFYMVKGDASLGENSFSRAYVNFTNPNDIYDFREKFDNYVFLDSAGHEYPAVVEFAAFQKVPKRRNKVRVDPKVGTIETDPYYLEFVEMMNKPKELDEKPEYTYQINETKNELNEITPLLEYVKNRRVEKMRIREERREERKRKEFERKKFKDDERKKRFEEKSPIVSKAHSKPKEAKEESEKVEDKLSTEEKHEKGATNSYYKNKERKYEDRKSKDTPKKYPPKKEYPDKREYRKREDYKEREYRPKYDEYKKEDPKSYQKKVKKYSEKREERKIEAQKKLEQENEAGKQETNEAKETCKKEEKASPKKENEQESAKLEEKEAKRDLDQQSQKRIRNKDRPTIAIYRPGMLSKRKTEDGDKKD